MKFLLDVCVSSQVLIDSLLGPGHDVLSAYSIDPRSDDSQLLDRALADDRVLITEDKDFGELIFVQNRLHGPIVRLVELSVDEHVLAVGELLANYQHELTGAVIFTVTRGRIRIRRRTG